MRSPSTCILVVALGALLCACAGCASEPGTSGSGAQGAPDASQSDAPEAASDSPIDQAAEDSTAEDVADALQADGPWPGDAGDAGDAYSPDAHDSSAPDGGDSGTGPFLPDYVRVGEVHSGPVAVSTPPTWNAHLPKLVGDGTYWYAVHTHAAESVEERHAVILRSHDADPTGPWTTVETLQYPHQPPGIVMDTSLRLHLVFDCLRPGSTDVTCFVGGAGTNGNTSRFYHLIFSARGPSGALLFGTYANYDEWTAESNGYMGIGTAADGTTWWSLSDPSWGRVVQWWADGGQYGSTGVLSQPNVYLLYPIMAAHPALGAQQLLLYAGEFDPSGGNNASYLASTAFQGNTSGLNLLLRRAPSALVPGAVNAYPSDVAYEADGTLLVLSYLPDGQGGCTELLRFDSGLSLPPAILPVGCVDNYAKLQVASNGTYYLLTSGQGDNMTVGISADRGATWTWHTVPFFWPVLPDNGDVRFFGFTPVKPYTSPAVYDPDKLVFLFSGYDAQNLAQFSYVGVMDLRE